MRSGGATSLQPLPSSVTPGPELGLGVLVGREFVFFFLLFFFLNNKIGYIHFPKTWET